MKKVAIITYSDCRFEENLELDYLKTLYSEAKFDGYLYILDYGITDSVKERIRQNYPVNIVDCLLSESVFTSRYRDISKIIDSLPEDVGRVITMDSGDIWFQDLLEGIKGIEDNYLSLCEEDRIWGIDEWTNKCLSNISLEKRTEILRWIEGKPVKNSGVIVADKYTMKILADAVYRDICEYGYEFFGIDQIFVNYEISKLFDDRYKVLSEVYNYVVVSNSNNYIIKNDLLYKKTGEKIIIVHNAGGNWRVLKRPFCNKNSNEQQYVIENIYKIEK